LDYGEKKWGSRSIIFFTKGEKGETKGEIHHERYNYDTRAQFSRRLGCFNGQEKKTEEKTYARSIKKLRILTSEAGGEMEGRTTTVSFGRVILWREIRKD